VIARGVVLAMLLTLGPRVPRARLEPIADAIATTATTRAEAVALVVLEFKETSLGRGGPPFGLSCCAHRLADAPLAAWAATALGIWRAGERACGSMGDAAFYFNVGRCPMRVRGHSRAFRRAGRRGLVYARSVAAITARLAP